MTDPLFDAVAAALAGQAISALGAAGMKAVSKIREIVRRKSEQDEPMRAALEAAEKEAAGPAEIKVLAERLDQGAADDPEFAEQLRSEGATVQNEISVSGNAVVNQFSGTADKLIQARDIHGGITLN